MTGLPISKKYSAQNTFREVPRYEQTDLNIKKSDFPISVIIPTIRSLDNIDKIISALSLDLLLEIIVVLDRKITSKDKQFISKWNRKVIIRPTNKSLGAGLARNEGINIAKGDIIVFIDDDCYPSPNWIQNHINHYSNPNVVAVGAPIFFLNPNNGRKKHILDECSLLFSFRASLYYDVLFWNPTSNISVRTEIAKKCLFKNVFPKNGGGEDVFFGLQLSKYGKIMAEPEAWVVHPFWQGKWNISKRFIRWGYADCILASECSKEKELKHRLIPRELTPISWFIIALTAGVLLSFLSNNFMYSLLPLGGTLTWVLFEFFFWHKDKGIKHSAVEIISVLFFDLGSTISRLNPRYWSILYHRILFFPDQLIWLWLATGRVRNATLLGYIIILSLITYFSK